MEQIKYTFEPVSSSNFCLNMLVVKGEKCFKCREVNPSINLN